MSNVNAISVTLPSYGAGESVRPEKIGQKLGGIAAVDDSSVANYQHLVCDIENTALMGDDDLCVIALVSQLLENAYQTLEAPDVDSRLGLVEDVHCGLSCEDTCDLYSFLLNRTFLLVGYER